MKFLFASAHCLNDNSSGAAISMLTLLKALAKEGHSVIALGGTVFDTQTAAGKHGAPWHGLQPSQTASYLVDGVRHVLVRTRHWDRRLMLSAEEEVLDLTYRTILDKEAPDVVLTYGGMVLERGFLAEAKSRGIKTVFRLVNPSYPFKFIFNDVDHIVTDSQETAKLYKDRLDINLDVLGALIDPDSFRTARPAPEYVTFVNPQPAKGASMVARLALMCQKHLPDVRFLVIESRGRWKPSIESMGLKSEDFPNVTVWPMQSDMRKVYACTKVLLLPSFWHESGGRVALEAMINGIPVLAESQGGAKELLRGGGTLLDISAEVRAKPDRLVSETDARLWFAALKALLSNKRHYERASTRALKAAEGYTLPAQIRRFLDVVGLPQS